LLWASSAVHSSSLPALFKLDTRTPTVKLFRTIVRFATPLTWSSKQLFHSLYRTRCGFSLRYRLPRCLLVLGASVYFLSSLGLRLWTLLSLKATSIAKTQDVWRPLCQGAAVI
jgi:hypothetical protein